MDFRDKKFLRCSNEFFILMFAFITFNSSFVLLIEGLCDSNSWEFAFLCCWMLLSLLFIHTAAYSVKNYDCDTRKTLHETHNKEVMLSVLLDVVIDSDTCIQRIKCIIE